jgi:hypothetical protein
MISIRKKAFFPVFGALFGVLFLLTASPFSGVVYAQQSIPFFVNPAYDTAGNSSVTATLMYEGNKAQYFVEDGFVASLSSVGRQQLDDALADLSKTFDEDIYNRETLVFGLPRTPGIDNNLKITVLLTPMSNNVGGYFRGDDEQPRTAIADSNQREMVYLNTDFVARYHAKEFLAHEFQHLINYNQKTFTRGVAEEVWLNELLSEVAPTIAGLHDTLRSNTNLADRKQVFLANPGESFIDWHNAVEDYAAVNVLGHYLLDRYGEGLFTALEQSTQTGIAALNEALARVGAGETFDEVFRDWTIAVLINDCSVGPSQAYCYTNMNFSPDTFRLDFVLSDTGSDTVVSSDILGEWAVGWSQYSSDISTTKPEKPFLVYKITATDGQDFSVPYVVESQDGPPQVFLLQVTDGTGSFAIDDFGFTVSTVTVILSNQTIGSSLRILEEASLQKEAAGVDASKTITLSNGDEERAIPDGSLIRLEGSSRVYIVKGTYGRWIQSPVIMDMYGHLRWEDIIDLPPETFYQFKDAALVRVAGDEKVYRISHNSTKLWIQNERDFLQAGYRFDMVYEINERELAWYR